jgi:hypothetical protein
MKQVVKLIGRDWVARENEITLKDFYGMLPEQKAKHLTFLQSLDDDELSSNDSSILHIAIGGKKIDVVKIQKGAIEDAQQFEKNFGPITDLTKEDCEEYLSIIFDKFPQWKESIKNLDIDAFIYKINLVVEIFPDLKKIIKHYKNLLK